MIDEKNGENDKEKKEEQTGGESAESREDVADDYNAEEEAEIQKRLEDLGYI